MLIAALMCIGACAPALAEGKGPSIEFEKKQIDMGNLHAGKGKAAFEFEFVNQGDAPLVIISASASCGCTKPKYPEAPVQPGQKGTIKVSYDPQGRRGDVSSTVTLRTNDKKHKKVVLRLKGCVIPEGK